MILAIDIGNTTVALGGIRDGRVCFVARMDTVRTRTAAEYRAEMDKIFAHRRHPERPMRFEGAVLTSVVPQITGALAECARIAERDEGAVCGAAFVAMLALMMVEAGLGVSGLAVLPAALAGALVALGLWAFPPARLGAGCCGSLLAAGAIGCIPLSLDMTSLTVPLALPFWAAGGLLAAQLLCAKRTGKPLRCWVKKHKMSPETVFLCSFALSAVGYVLALALLRWC
mgnify:FL=1